MSHLTRQFATRLSRDQSGSAVIEFALVLPLLLVLAFGILDFGKAFNFWIDQTHLANTGARWAGVDRNPGAADGLSLQQYIKSRANGSELKSGASVCITFPAGENVGDPVVVEVSYPYNWLQFLDNQPGSTLTSTTINSTATMRLEQAPSEYEAGCG
jgi:Flp pilus assembly protein TadG